MFRLIGRAVGVATLSMSIAACATPQRGGDSAAKVSPMPASAAPKTASKQAKIVLTPKFERTTAAAAGLDEARLAELLKRGETTRSDAVIIIRNGKLVVDERYGHEDGPIETMSMTKSLVAILIGRLVELGQLRSIDEPVSTFYPEWKQGKKAQITVRQLLEQTSGLQSNRTTEEIYASPDFIRLALAAELTSDPGEKFFYNNKAVNILAGIIQIAGKKRMDVFAKDELFGPMGIEDFEWTLDKAGNPHAMSGAKLHPLDLAAIGQMMLDHGVYSGRQIVGADWIAKSTEPSPKNRRYGWLTWVDQESSFVLDDSVFDAWKKAGLEPAFIAKIRPLKDRVFKPKDDFFGTIATAMGGEKQAALESWYDHTWRRGLPDAKPIDGKTIGFHFDGYLGQSMVVVPDKHLVAVRMRRAREGEGNGPEYNFGDFASRVRALVPAEP